jgi:hypothetical protein
MLSQDQSISSLPACCIDVRPDRYLKPFRVVNIVVLSYNNVTCIYIYTIHYTLIYTNIHFTLYTLYIHYIHYIYTIYTIYTIHICTCHSPSETKENLI